jgi:hypothetical protein
MTTVMLMGHAEWQGERFDFKIGEMGGRHRLDDAPHGSRQHEGDWRRYMAIH